MPVFDELALAAFGGSTFVAPGIIAAAVVVALALAVGFIVFLAFSPRTRTGPATQAEPSSTRDTGRSETDSGPDSNAQTNFEPGS
ncbi:hypothetical protein [Natrinema caseinilyticum]|uniref:hypothetical protein n=1 Tax=Natrinema caseinilyticum TaxID=2961570 RepID=UPI0020C2846E|nr:hypothetical protein [Natrinema caseinilyticum]